MAAILVREARVQDALALAEAQRVIARLPGRLASRPEEILDDDIRAKILAATGAFRVAERDGVLVGHAFLEPLSLAATAHVCKLTIAVHEGYQRQGAGRALMTSLLDWARASPAVDKVELQVRATNVGAIALYSTLGFVEEGRKTRRINVAPGQYLDDIYMALWVGA